MKTFSQFLIEHEYGGTRTKKISSGAFDDLVRENCAQNIKDIVNRECVVYRGDFRLEKENYLYLDSNKTKEDRKAANTKNFSNLYMSNSPEWKDYPQRNKSFICTTNPTYARGYSDGKIFVMIPFDNTPIGICPGDDIFGSFKIFGYHRISRTVSEVLRALELSDDDNTWDDFKAADKALKEKAAETDEKKWREIVMPFARDGAYNVVAIADKFTTSLYKDGLEKTFDLFLGDPKKHGFDKTTIMNFASKNNNEVWFSGKALAINVRAIGSTYPSSVSYWLREKFSDIV
jgi:hypothetical protein